ncbi:nitroreductase [bacterium]|nr:nitroreductase [bacterium]
MPNEHALDLIARRKSTPAKMLTDPGPSREEITALLRLAMRAPDHRKLEPWRFIVVLGDGRHRLGEVFAAVRTRREPAASPQSIEEDRQRPMRAPVMVAVVSSPVEDPRGTPQWEQELSAGAVCQNLMLACFAAGWAASWITEWPAYDRDVATAIGLSPSERISGFILIGTAREDPVERDRPDPAAKITWWED